MSVLRAALCNHPALCASCSRHAIFVVLLVSVLGCPLNSPVLSLHIASYTCSRPLVKEASRGVQERGRPAGPGAVGGPPPA
eukprot:6617718-Pyramimonas_sp.AAC.1